MLKSSVVGAIVGPKGAGKSLLLATFIVHQLIAGKTVWSNMKVHTGKTILAWGTSPGGRKIEYCETQPLDWNLLYSLDESLIEGVVAIDEMSYFAGSRQSMDTRNRLINACVRQVRHRCLDFFYTARKFNWVDSYLRDETDFMVECEDLCYSPWGRTGSVPPGTMFCLKYYDISGAITGKSVYDGDTRRGWHYYCEQNFYGPPFHDCYDTREIISIEEAFTGVKMGFKKRYIGNEPNKREEHEEIREKILQGIRAFKDTGQDRIPTHVFFDYLKAQGVEGDPTSLGRLVPREVGRLARHDGFLYDFSKVEV